jgi:hypothetical protein
VVSEVPGQVATCLVPEKPSHPSTCQRIG